MKKLILLLCLVLFNGCASFNQPFTPEFYRPDPVVLRLKVKTEKELRTVCNYNKIRPILGCAHVPVDPKGLCVTYMYENGSEETREHEDKHCIYGRWHD